MARRRKQQVATALLQTAEGNNRADQIAATGDLSSLYDAFGANCRRRPMQSPILRTAKF